MAAAVSPGVIDTVEHPLIQPVLRLVLDRQARDSTGRFFTDGIGFTFQSLQAGFVPDRVIVAPELLVDPVARRLVRDLERQGHVPVAVSAELFCRLSRVTNPQGIGVVLRQRWIPLRRADPHAGTCWLAAFRIQSPGNLGTLLRTATAVGAAGLICVGPDLDPYQPGVIRPTMGAIFRLGLVRTTIERFLQWTFRHRLPVIGTSPRGTSCYDRFRFRGPCVVCLGHEREGLSPEEQAVCDVMLQIPMAGPQDSLNVAIAGSVVLYEMFRQQRLTLTPAPGKRGHDRKRNDGCSD